MKPIRYLSILLCILTLGVSFQYLTTITTVSCSLNTGESLEPCPQELSNQLQYLQGTSLLKNTNDSHLIEQKQYQLTSANKVFPKKIELIFVPQYTLYILNDTKGVSPDGVTLPLATHHSSRPKVILPDLLEYQEDTVPEEYHLILQTIITDLEKAHISVQKIDWSRENTIQVASDLPQLILLSPESVPDLSILLPQLRQHSTYQDKASEVTEIDLRFNYLILR